MAQSFAPETVHLSNGIPVILQHYDGMVAATYWWNQVGSADERPKEAGFAHFLEHMLFKDAAAKDTGKASTGQMARAIESLGGEINAYTSFDQTVYHVTCAAHHWERVLDSFGTMAKTQKFLKSDFVREREVILEELRKNEDSPGRQLFQTLLSSLFKKHPYGRPVIGFTKTLKAANVTDLEAFYRRNYTPSRMGVIMVGPIEDGTGARKKKLIQLLEKRFGKSAIPAKKAVPREKRVVEQAIRKGMEFNVKGFDVKTPTLTLGFRVPELAHEDVAALDVAASVLGMGELGRLYQRLFYEKSLVTEVSGGLYVPQDPGLIYFQSELESLDQVNVVAREMMEEIARLKNEGPTADELSRILTNAESERLYATQTADAMAGRLGFLNFGVNDPKFDEKFLEALREVDHRKVQEVAQKYFHTDRMSGVLMVPEKDKGFDAREIKDAAQKLLAPAPEAKASSVKSNQKKSAGKKDLVTLPEVFTLNSGIQVIYKENPLSHVMSLHAVALGGLRLELADPVESAAKDWGAAHMLAQTWTKGTSSRDSRAIASMVEGSASSLDGYSGRNTAGLQSTGLARDWDKLSGLFTEVLCDPIFPEAEVGHSRRVVEDTIRGIEDHSSQVCSKLFLETLFENHPYGKMTFGSMESVASMTSAKLKAFHRKWIRPERLVISAVGNIKRSQLDRWLDGLETSLKKVAHTSGSHPHAAVASIAEEPALKGPRWVEKQLGREQLHILVGGLGLRIDSEEKYAMQLLQTLLGGQSGRLFIELREKKSLAYTVAPTHFEGVERGYIGTYIACSPHKRQEALDGIKKVLETLAAKGPTPAEMKRAKEFYLGRRAMDLQSDSSLSTHYALKAVYGMPISEDVEIFKRIEAVGARHVQEVCRKYLVGQHMVTSVVG